MCKEFVGLSDVGDRSQRSRLHINCWYICLLIHILNCYLQSQLNVLTNSQCLTKVSCAGQPKCSYQLLRLTQGGRSRGRFSLESGSSAVVRSATWSSPGRSATAVQRQRRVCTTRVGWRGSARAAPALGPFFFFLAVAPSTWDRQHPGCAAVTSVTAASKKLLMERDARAGM